MAESNILKIVYVLDILKRTDEQHPINSKQIIEALDRKGLKAERKSIGKYIQVLRDEMGYDIVLCENKNLGWYMCGQEFEDYELKMLVDAVAEAQFISTGNSRRMIRKICNLATREGDRIIQSMLVMDDSLKFVDSKFAVKFDAIMRAIADRKKVSFLYLEVQAGGKKIPKKDGKRYTISPYYLGVWGHEYFVVANMEGYDNVSVYRVEMMDAIEMVKAPVRSMNEVNELKRIGKNGRTFIHFIKESVNLQTGEVRSIKLSGTNKLRREVMKKFGNTLSFRDQGTERFQVYIDACEGRGFYQWIAQFGNLMKIEGPEDCVENYKRFLMETLEQYE